MLTGLCVYPQFQRREHDRFRRRRAHSGHMDQSQAPVLEAPASYHANGHLAFTPPGHKQGRGADPWVVRTLGPDVFRGDVLATGGLDDRLSSRGILEHAQALMAGAVGADHTFFSTCGSSLSVKATMLTVAGPHEAGKDDRLLALASACHPQTLRQIRWTNTLIKNLSPQILTSL